MEFTEENSEFELDFGEIMEGGEVTGGSSVNGYTGDVVLSAQDVGAATPAQVAQTKADSQTYTDEKVAAVKEAVEAEIPTDTADLTNGAGFQNGVEVASAITSGISDHNSSATAHPAIRTQISTINSKIPAEASVSNQLADKTFVSGLVSDEASARELADTNLQGQIDAITSASDVVDVVGTYSELQAYDTQHLKDNDIVKVLVDETHDNAITYYRWTHSTTPYSWIYIGSQGPFYTKAESDTLLNEKADKSNTYTKTEVDTALAGKVDKVAGKGLSTNDFTTEEKTKLAGLENTVLESTTGQSTTAGMTQKAITDALASAGGAKVLTAADYNYPVDDPTSVALWKLTPGIYYRDNSSTSVKISKISNLGNDVAIVGTKEGTFGNVSILKLSYRNNTYGGKGILTEYGVRKTDDAAWDGVQSYVNNINAEIVDSLTSDDNSRPLSANQGKVLKDLIDSLVISGAGAPTTSTVGTVGKLYEDTTNGDLYQCTAVSGSTYTWEEVGGGSGVNVVQTTGQSTTDVMSQKAITDALASAGGGVKVLTTADYNWPTSNPTSVALWTLEPGVYIKDSKEVILIPSDSHSSLYVKEYGTFLIANAEDIPGTLSITCFADTNSTFGSNPIRMFIVKKADGDEYSYSNTFNYYIDNLTSTETNKGLSANQGKVLNDKIVALEARIAALEGNA